jgi:hypothetical protein
VEVSYGVVIDLEAKIVQRHDFRLFMLFAGNCSIAR